MPRRATRSEALASSAVALLTIEWGGQTYRFSTQPIAVTTDHGEVYHYHGGLTTPDVARAFELFGSDGDPVSVPFSIRFPCDVPLRVAQGHRLSQAVGEFALVRYRAAAVLQTWENRQVLVASRLSSPRYGDAETPVQFSLEGEAEEDRGRILEPHPITSTMLTNAQQEAVGKNLPVVIGRPGVYMTDGPTTNRVTAMPAYRFDSGADIKFALGRHRMTATSARVYDSSGNSDDLTILYTQDGYGRLYAYAAPNWLSTSLASQDEHYYWTPLGDVGAGGMLDPYDGGMLEGAGNVLRWLLGQSTLAWDRQRTIAAASLLNRFKLAFYVDDSTIRPKSMIIDDLLPLLPVTIQVGPNGLYPVVWRYEAEYTDAVASVTEGPGFKRQGHVTEETELADLVNDFTIRFAPRLRSGNLTQYVRCCPEPTAAESREFSSLAAQASYGLLEYVASKEMETKLVYDRRTARQIALWKVQASAMPPRTVTYAASPEWDWLEPGDLVNLTDTGLHLTNQLCHVADFRYGAAGRDNTLQILEIPGRDRMPATT